MSPLQRGVLHVLVGSDAVLLLDVPLVRQDDVADPAAGVDHLHGLFNQLECVSVAGDDEDLPSGGCPVPGESGDDVVGLEALLAELGDVERLQHLVHQWQLAAEVIRRLLALCLVLGIGLRPEGLT